MENQIDNLLIENAKVVGYITTTIGIICSALCVLIYGQWFVGIFGLISFVSVLSLEKCKFSINENSKWMYATGIISCIFTILCLFFMLGRSFISLVF